METATAIRHSRESDGQQGSGKLAHTAQPFLRPSKTDDGSSSSNCSELVSFFRKVIVNDLDRNFLLGLERDYKAFIIRTAETGNRGGAKSLGSMELTPQNSYHRMLAHRLADLYGLDHSSDVSPAFSELDGMASAGPGSGSRSEPSFAGLPPLSTPLSVKRSIVIQIPTRDGTRVRLVPPKEDIQSMTHALEKAMSPDAPHGLHPEETASNVPTVTPLQRQQLSILKRDAKAAAAACGNGDSPNQVGANGGPLSYEEKQNRYQEARRRIFGDSEPVSSSSSLVDGMAEVGLEDHDRPSVSKRSEKSSAPGGACRDETSKEHAVQAASNKSSRSSSTQARKTSAHESPIPLPSIPPPSTRPDATHWHHDAGLPPIPFQNLWTNDHRQGQWSPYGQSHLPYSSASGTHSPALAYPDVYSSPTHDEHRAHDYAGLFAPHAGLSLDHELAAGYYTHAHPLLAYPLQYSQPQPIYDPRYHPLPPATGTRPTLLANDLGVSTFDTTPDPEFHTVLRGPPRSTRLFDPNANHSQGQGRKSSRPR